MNKEQSEAIYYLQSKNVPLSQVMRNQQNGYSIINQAKTHIKNYRRRNEII